MPSYMRDFPELRVSWVLFWQKLGRKLSIPMRLEF